MWEKIKKKFEFRRRERRREGKKMGEDGGELEKGGRKNEEWKKEQLRG